MDANPVIEAHFCAISPDANLLDHSEWAHAKPVWIIHYWSGELAPSSVHAEVRLLWTTEFFAVRFVCNQSQPLIVSPNPQLQEKTIGLWERDVCEIFLAPDPQKANRYFEFEAAPTGEWVDIAIEMTPSGRVSDFKFRSGMTVDTRVTETQVRILMRVPWTNSISQPQTGDVWRCNLFRCVGLGNERYLAWRPTHTLEPNFHVPEAFGTVRFN